MVIARQVNVGGVIGWILVVACLLSSVHSQEAAAEAKPQQQDPIALLEKSDKSFFDIRTEADALWAKDEKLRSRLVLLVAKKNLAPNIFIGVGSVLAEKGAEANAGSTLQLYISAIVDGRFTKPSDVDKAIEYVIVSFHHRGLVLGELSKHSSVTDPKRLNRLVGLFQSLVKLSRPVGVNGRASDRPHTRFAAVNQLVSMLTANPPIDSASSSVIMDALSKLTADQVQMTEPAEWNRWWQTLSARPGIGSDKTLSIDAILTALLEEERAQSENLRQQLLQESLAVLDHMETMKLPPLDHVVSSHKAVRSRAIAVVKAVLPHATAEWRKKTLDRVMALLDDSSGVPTTQQEVVDIAGALGAVVDEADQARLSKQILRVPVDGQPKLAESVLKSIIAMGIVSDIAPISALYEMAKEGGEQWLAVKQSAMKAAQLNGRGLPLVIHALDDPVAAVRGDAALAIEALQDAEVPAGGVLPVVALAHHALKETDAGARGRMLESLGVLIRSKPSRLTPEALGSVVALVKHVDAVPRMAALGILTAAIAGGALSPELQEVLVKGLGESLLVSNNEDEWAKTVDTLLSSSTDSSAEILANWFAGQASTPGPTWRRLAAHFRQSWNKNPGRLWDTAVSLAALDREGALTDALPFGRRAIELIAAVPNHPMSRRLSEFGAFVARWQVGTRDAKACAEALLYLNTRLQESPNDGRILLLRADALQILGRPNDAADDIALALGKGAPSLGNLPHGPLLRRLARYRFMAERWADCRSAVNVLIRLKSNQPGDVLMTAWTDVLELGGDRRRALSLAAPLVHGQMADAAALLQATAGLSSADSTLRKEALTHLAAVKDSDDPLLAELNALVQHGKALGKLLQQSPLDALAVKAQLAIFPHQSTAILVARLRTNSQSALLVYLKELHPQDKTLQAIVWPEAGKGDPEAVAWALVKWADGRPLPKKLIASCLKGAAPHI